jgi:hypothetical protein
MFRRFRKQQTEPTLSDSSSAVARGLQNSKLPKGRQSVEPNSLEGFLTLLQDTFSGYPSDTRKRIIKVFRNLAQSDDDVGGALRDVQILGNTPYTWQLEGGKRAQTQALDELTTFDRRVFSGGFKALADNQVREVFITGASSLEWVPFQNRKGILNCEIVPAEEIDITKTLESLLYKQDLNPNGYLHPVTYQYRPFDTDGRSPYGIPPAITALQTLWRKRKLMLGEDRVISALQKLAFLVATFKKPSPMSFGLPSEGPEYERKLQGWAETMADIIAAQAENGFALLPEGLEAKANNITTNTSGAVQIQEANNRMLWSGLGTLPFMRGKMDSTTQALSEIVYPILLAFTSNIMETVDGALEYGANLHLRLVGIPVTAKIVRQESNNPFKVQSATVAQMEATTDKLLAELYGYEYLVLSAKRRGFEFVPEKPKSPEPEGKGGDEDEKEEG